MSDMTGLILCGLDERPVPDTTSDCADRDQHTPAPDGYIQWQDWAARMTRNRAKQKRCPGCGLYKIWTSPRRPMPDVAAPERGREGKTK